MELIHQMSPEFKAGKLAGLEEAAAICEMAADTSKRVNFLYGGKTRTGMIVNQSLLRSVASTIREWAEQFKDAP